MRSVAAGVRVDTSYVYTPLAKPRPCTRALSSAACRVVLRRTRLRRFINSTNARDLRPPESQPPPRRAHGRVHPPRCLRHATRPVAPHLATTERPTDQPPSPRARGGRLRAPPPPPIATAAAAATAGADRIRHRGCRVISSSYTTRHAPSRRAATERPTDRPPSPRAWGGRRRAPLPPIAAAAAAAAADRFRRRRQPYPVILRARRLRARAAATTTAAPHTPAHAHRRSRATSLGRAPPSRTHRGNPAGPAHAPHPPRTVMMTWHDVA